MTIEAWQRVRRAKGKGICWERREKNHVRDTQIIVIRKKRTKQQKKQRGNCCIITEKPRKETNGSTRKKAVLHCSFNIHKIQLQFCHEQGQAYPQNRWNPLLFYKPPVQLFPQGSHGLVRGLKGMHTVQWLTLGCHYSLGPSILHQHLFSWEPDLNVYVMSRTKRTTLGHGHKLECYTPRCTHTHMQTCLVTIHRFPIHLQCKEGPGNSTLFPSRFQWVKSCGARGNFQHPCMWCSLGS